MSDLSSFVRLEIALLLGLLGAVIFYQVLTGRINTRAMLYDKSETAGYSPARLQLLLTSLGGAGFFLLKVFEDPTRFPDVPPEGLLAVGGSQVLYLGGKSLPLISRLTNGGAAANALRRKEDEQ